MRKLVAILLFFTIHTVSSYAQSYQDMVNRAIDYTDQKDYQAAEQAMKAAMRKEPANPNNVMLMVNLGTIQRNIGKMEEALISYNVAIEKYPNVTSIRHSRASLYCDMNRYDDALKDYNTILALNADDQDALYYRGLLNLNNKNLLASEEDFDKLIEINPKNLKGRSGLAMIKKHRSEWNEAEKLYTDLIYEYKTNAELYFNRAECYLQMNKLARCSEDIAKAIELGYEDAPVYLLRGQLRLAQFDKHFAKIDFLKAKELGMDEMLISDFLKQCK